MTEKKAHKLPEAGGWPDKVGPWLGLVGGVLTTVGFLLTFFYAPLVNGASVDGVEMIGGQMVSNMLLLSQKIFYFHMPVAITSFVALAFTAYYGIRFLMTKEKRFDTCGKIATEIALVFILCTMFSGEMWERFEWGVWWTWEPRLTTYFILMLLVIGYFILRNAIDDPERRATYASVFGIIAFVDAPICFMITRLIPSGVHPTIFRTDSGLSPDMLLPLLLSMFGMFMIAFALYRYRFRQVRLTERVEAVKELLED
ncbi:cytochrome c biogenesis protein [Eggerthella guodeyinii]|uniref:Heme exporter protein C n=1 Tax=Eggerthella guodeyinii TaxID=2690837 RepID=A0A6N7RMD3_9ACTN|nr:cytochrome c biogenesis protein [Eggerthella guodeyinii]MRX82127.1 cytochrome C assembly protein [Eggerthella guodeyinii]